MNKTQLESFNRLTSSPDGQVFFDYLADAYVHRPLKGATTEETLYRAAQHDLVIELRDLQLHGKRTDDQS